MRLTINQNSNISETEVIINCTYVDAQIRHLIDCICQFSCSLEGDIENSHYYIPLERILYIESVDKKTFIYDENMVYLCKETLSSIEKKTKKYFFIRVSKNFIVNLLYVSCTHVCGHHRLEIIMQNGEHIAVGRAYAGEVKTCLSSHGADFMNLYCAESQSCLCRTPVNELQYRSVLNAGRITAYPCTPERVIALSYGQAELLAALGQASRLITIAPAESRLSEVSDLYYDQLKNVPLLQKNSEGVPDLSNIQAFDPDFIFVTYYTVRTWQRKQNPDIHNLPANIYLSEATLPEKATLESVYRDILNLGRIFRAEDKAIHLVEKYRKQIASLTCTIPQKNAPKVFIYDGGKALAHTAGKGALETDLIRLAGGINIFQDEPAPYLSVPWETVRQSAPDFILVHNYADWMPVKEKTEFLMSKTELQDTPAIRNKNLIQVTLTEIFPGIQNVALVQRLAQTFYPEVF